MLSHYLTYWATIAQANLDPLPKITPDQDNVKNVLNAAFIIAGLLAVAFVAFGGLKYVLSNGDSNAVAQAKNTILYALIGLAVTILASVLVNFVLNWV